MPTIARAAVLLAGVTGVFALVLWPACGGDDDDPTPTPSPAVQASPTATPSPSPTATPRPPPVVADSGVTPLEVGNLVRFPESVAFITETGCARCPEPPTGLRRMYRDAATGELRVEQLLEINRLGLGSMDAYFTGYAIAPDASYLLAGVCIRGGCGQFDGSTEDARTALYESRDGGVTWIKVAQYDLAMWVVGLVGPRTALVHWEDVAAGSQRYALYPGLAPVEPPGEEHVPVLGMAGEVVWESLLEEGRLFRSDGSLLLDLGEGGFVRRSWTVAMSAGDPLVVHWNWFPDGDPRSDNYQTLVSMVGHEGEILSTYEVHPSSVWVYGGVRYGDAGLIATMADPPLISPRRDLLGLPALLDLDLGRYRLVEEPFLNDDYDAQTDRVHAVQTGPFARVVNLSGGCLNVRESASIEAPVLACVANGALLRYSSIDPAADVWLPVVTPQNIFGWAAVEFLEY